MGSLWRWLQKPGPEPKLLAPWPITRLPKRVTRVNEPLTDKELAVVRLSAQRGRSLGDEAWVESTARRLKLVSTIRLRGRQRVQLDRQTPIKDA